MLIGSLIWFTSALDVSRPLSSHSCPEFHPGWNVGPSGQGITFGFSVICIGAFGVTI